MYPSLLFFNVNFSPDIIRHTLTCLVDAQSGFVAENYTHAGEGGGPIAAVANSCIKKIQQAMMSWESLLPTASVAPEVTNPQGVGIACPRGPFLVDLK